VEGTKRVGKVEKIDLTDGVNGRDIELSLRKTQGPNGVLSSMKVRKAVLGVVGEREKASLGGGETKESG